MNEEEFSGQEERLAERVRFAGTWQQQVATVLELRDRGQLSERLATALVPSLWRDRPDGDSTGYEAWRDLFAHARYTRDSVPVRRPRLRQHLYRGAVEENRWGLSWTTDAGQAAYFARARQEPGRLGCVWQAWVEPERVFARIDGREAERVVDARGMQVEPAPDWIQALVLNVVMSARPRWWWSPARRLARRPRRDISQ